jgi:hypothetical protein
VSSVCVIRKDERYIHHRYELRSDVQIL